MDQSDQAEDQYCVKPFCNVHRCILRIAPSSAEGKQLEAGDVSAEAYGQYNIIFQALSSPMPSISYLF